MYLCVRVCASHFEMFKWKKKLLRFNEELKNECFDDNADDHYDDKIIRMLKTITSKIGDRPFWQHLISSFTYFNAPLQHRLLSHTIRRWHMHFYEMNKNDCQAANKINWKGRPEINRFFLFFFGAQTKAIPQIPDNNGKSAASFLVNDKNKIEIINNDIT